MALFLRVFKVREIREARQYALDGGIAVHLHWMVFPKSPACFKRDVNAGKPIAHVFCQSVAMLKRIARENGIREVYIDREGTPSQHVREAAQPAPR